jgi:hypothetical protein
MWITVLVLAGAVMFEPIRLGLVVLLLSRRRPLVQLLVFLGGGFAMGVGAGLVVLFVLRTAPVAGHVDVPEVQIASGLVALVIAAVLATKAMLRKLVRPVPADAAVGGGGGVGLLEGAAPTGRRPLAERARSFVRGDSLGVAAVSGMGASLPSANYMGSMAAILASHAAPVTQVQALLAFNLVAFTVAEIPLIGYLAAPQKTRAFMGALQNWLRSRGHRDIAALVAAGGCLMLILGVTGAAAG